MFLVPAFILIQAGLEVKCSQESTRAWLNGVEWWFHGGFRWGENGCCVEPSGLCIWLRAVGAEEGINFLFLPSLCHLIQRQLVLYIMVLFKLSCCWRWFEILARELVFLQIAMQIEEWCVCVFYCVCGDLHLGDFFFLHLLPTSE